MKRNLLIKELPREPKITLYLDSVDGEFAEEQQQLDDALEGIKGKVRDIANKALTLALDEMFGENLSAYFFLDGSDELGLSFHDNCSIPDDEDAWESVWSFRDLVDAIPSGNVYSADDLKKIAGFFQEAADKLLAASATEG